MEGWEKQVSVKNIFEPFIEDIATVFSTLPEFLAKLKAAAFLLPHTVVPLSLPNGLVMHHLIEVHHQLIHSRVISEELAHASYKRFYCFYSNVHRTSCHDNVINSYH